MSISQPKPCPGYPISVGPKTEIIVDIFGNNNYQTTGDVYTASQFGLSGIESVHFQRTQSQNYSVAAVPPANSSNANEQYAPTSNNFTALWFTAANGNAVANNSNLAVEVARCQIRGIL